MSEVTHKYVNLYEKLFTFGSFYRVISTYLSFYFFYVLITYVKIYNSGGINVFVVISFLPLYSTILDYVLIRSVIRGRDSQIFSLRRILGKHYLFFLISMGYLVLSLIPNMLFTPMNPIYDVFALISVMVFSDLLIFIPILYNGFIKSYLLSIIKVIPPIFIITGFSSEVFSIYNFIPLVVAFVPISIFYMYINRLSRKSGSVKGPLLEYLKGYIDSWMLDDPNYLDRLLEEGSIDIKTKVDVIIFPDSYPLPSILLIPYFHFGPFKNIGSSSFPAIASSYMYSEKKLNATVFHTPSTHELDISSNEKVFKIIEQFGSFKNPVICNKISNIVKVSHGDAAAYGFRFCNGAVIFLEYKEMEDIPYQVIQEIEGYAKERGFENVSIIDCHNSLVNKSLVLTSDAINEIVIAAKNLIDRLKREGLSMYKVANEKVIPPSVTALDGLGSNGISIVYFETMSASNCIITIDSNNLSPNLKKKIEDLMGKLNIDKYVICTTDTHEVTALDLVEGGYRVLGEDEKTSQEIVRSIDLVLRNIRAKLRSSDIHFYRFSITTKVLGYDLIEKLGELSLSAFKMFKNFMLLGTFTLVLVLVAVPFIII